MIKRRFIVRPTTSRYAIGLPRSRSERWWGRLVALLLIPCLVGDALIPACAATFGKWDAALLADPGHAAGFASELAVSSRRVLAPAAFLIQALAEEPAMSCRKIESLGQAGSPSGFRHRVLELLRSVGRVKRLFGLGQGRSRSIGPQTAEEVADPVVRIGVRDLSPEQIDALIHLMASKPQWSFAMGHLIYYKGHRRDPKQVNQFWDAVERQPPMARRRIERLAAADLLFDNADSDALEASQTLELALASYFPDITEKVNRWIERNQPGGLGDGNPWRKLQLYLCNPSASRPKIDFTPGFSLRDLVSRSWSDFFRDQPRGFYEQFRPTMESLIGQELGKMAHSPNGHVTIHIGVIGAAWGQEPLSIAIETDLAFQAAGVDRNKLDYEIHVFDLPSLVFQKFRTNQMVYPDGLVRVRSERPHQKMTKEENQSAQQAEKRKYFTLTEGGDWVPAARLHDRMRFHEIDLLDPSTLNHPEWQGQLHFLALHNVLQYVRPEMTAHPERFDEAARAAAKFVSSLLSPDGLLSIYSVAAPVPLTQQLFAPELGPDAFAHFRTLREHLARVAAGQRPPAPAAGAERPAVTSPVLPPLVHEVKTFVGELNPYIHQVIAYPSIGATLRIMYPKECDVETDVAKILLERRFVRSVAVRKIVGTRYGSTHAWLEIDIGGDKYFYSSLEGLFTYSEDPRLRGLLDFDEFFKLYWQFGYARPVLEKIDGEFYARHGLAPSWWMTLWSRLRAPFTREKAEMMAARVEELQNQSFAAGVFPGELDRPVSLRFFDERPPAEPREPETAHSVGTIIMAAILFAVSLFALFTRSPVLEAPGYVWLSGLGFLVAVQAVVHEGILHGGWDGYKKGRRLKVLGKLLIMQAPLTPGRRWTDAPAYTLLITFPLMICISLVVARWFGFINPVSIATTALIPASLLDLWKRLYHSDAWLEERSKRGMDPAEDTSPQTAAPAAKIPTGQGQDAISNERGLPARSLGDDRLSSPQKPAGSDERGFQAKTMSSADYPDRLQLYSWLENNPYLPLRDLSESAAVVDVGSSYGFSTFDLALRLFTLNPKLRVYGVDPGSHVGAIRLSRSLPPNISFIKDDHRLAQSQVPAEPFILTMSFNVWVHYPDAQARQQAAAEMGARLSENGLLILGDGSSRTPDESIEFSVWQRHGDQLLLRDILTNRIIAGDEHSSLSSWSDYLQASEAQRLRDLFAPLDQKVNDIKAEFRKRAAPDVQGINPETLAREREQKGMTALRAVGIPFQVSQAGLISMPASGLGDFAIRLPTLAPKTESAPAQTTVGPNSEGPTPSDATVSAAAQAKPDGNGKPARRARFSPGSVFFSDPFKVVAFSPFLEEFLRCISEVARHTGHLSSCWFYAATLFYVFWHYVKYEGDYQQGRVKDRPGLLYTLIGTMWLAGWLSLTNAFLGHVITDWLIRAVVMFLLHQVSNPLAVHFGWTPASLFSSSKPATKDPNPNQKPRKRMSFQMIKDRAGRQLGGHFNQRVKQLAAFIEKELPGIQVSYDDLKALLRTPEITAASLLHGKPLQRHLLLRQIERLSTRRPVPVQAPIGKPYKVGDSFPGRKLQGTLTRIAPDPIRRKTLRVTVKRKDGTVELGQLSVQKLVETYGWPQERARATVLSALPSPSEWPLSPELKRLKKWQATFYTDQPGRRKVPETPAVILRQIAADIDALNEQLKAVRVEMAASLAAEVPALRIKKKMSMTDLAEKAEISEATLSQIENRRTPYRPDDDVQARLAFALDVPLERLAPGRPEEQYLEQSISEARRLFGYVLDIGSDAYNLRRPDIAEGTRLSVTSVWSAAAASGRLSVGSLKAIAASLENLTEGRRPEIVLRTTDDAALREFSLGLRQKMGQALRKARLSNKLMLKDLVFKLGDKTKMGETRLSGMEEGHRVTRDEQIWSQLSEALDVPDLLAPFRSQLREEKNRELSIKELEHIAGIWRQGDHPKFGNLKTLELTAKRDKTTPNGLWPPRNRIDFEFGDTPEPKTTPAALGATKRVGKLPVAREVLLGRMVQILAGFTDRVMTAAMRAALLRRVSAPVHEEAPATDQLLPPDWHGDPDEASQWNALQTGVEVIVREAEVRIARIIADSLRETRASVAPHSERGAAVSRTLQESISRQIQDWPLFILVEAKIFSALNTGALTEADNRKLGQEIKSFLEHHSEFVAQDLECEANVTMGIAYGILKGKASTPAAAHGLRRAMRILSRKGIGDRQSGGRRLTPEEVRKLGEEINHFLDRHPDLTIEALKRRAGASGKRIDDIRGVRTQKVGTTYITTVRIRQAMAAFETELSGTAPSSSPGQNAHGSSAPEPPEQKITKILDETESNLVRFLRPESGPEAAQTANAESAAPDAEPGSGSSASPKVPGAKRDRNPTPAWWERILRQRPDRQSLWNDPLMGPYPTSSAQRGYTNGPPKNDATKLPAAPLPIAPEEAAPAAQIKDAPQAAPTTAKPSGPTTAFMHFNGVTDDYIERAFLREADDNLRVPAAKRNHLALAAGNESGGGSTPSQNLPAAAASAAERFPWKTRGEIRQMKIEPIWGINLTKEDLPKLLRLCEGRMGENRDDMKRFFAIALLNGFVADHPNASKEMIKTLRTLFLESTQQIKDIRRYVDQIILDGNKGGAATGTFNDYVDLICYLSPIMTQAKYFGYSHEEAYWSDFSYVFESPTYLFTQLNWDLPGNERATLGETLIRQYVHAVRVMQCAGPFWSSFRTGDLNEAALLLLRLRYYSPHYFGIIKSQVETLAKTGDPRAEEIVKSVLLAPWVPMPAKFEGALNLVHLDSILGEIPDPIGSSEDCCSN